MIQWFGSGFGQEGSTVYDGAATGSPGANTSAETSAVHANRIALPSRDENRRGERRERRPLPSLAVEIRRIEPLLERALERRPLAVDRRVPCGVAVAALVDARLAEEALVGEAEPLRGGARRGVQGVALPLVAAIPELERALHHQI